MDNINEIPIESNNIDKLNPETDLNE